MEEKVYFIAITGTAGSGKTTVANILREYGYFVFDTDLFSKQILIEEKSIIGHIENITGQRVTEDGKLNFKKIGEFFDENPELERKFENWYQIFLGKKIIEKMLTLENEEKIIFLDIPMLQQKGIAHKFDYIWIIESEERKKYERITMRNNYSKEKIKYLIESSSIDKELLPTHFKIINNNCSMEKLKSAVKAELEDLTDQL